MKINLVNNLLSHTAFIPSFYQNRNWDEHKCIYKTDR